jgi:hypothetical protein
MTNNTNTTMLVARSIGIALIALLAFSVLGSHDSIVSAKETRSAVFGTVVNAPTDGLLEVATRRGVITLTINDKTKIDRKKGAIKLDDVTSGMIATGYYSESGDDLIAGKLTFRERNAKKTFEHVVGVILEKKGKKLKVKTTDGNEVEIEASDDPDDDATDQGSLIVTVVETDEESGDMDAKAVRTADKTIERLSDAIGSEISLAQEKLLKARVSETASAHLTKLYDTLDTIQADARAKIEAAFNEFQANYTTTLDDNQVAPPLAKVKGKVLSKTRTQLVVAANGNGRRSFLTIPDTVYVERIDGTDGALGDVTPGTYIEAMVTPQTETASPIVREIKLFSEPQTPGIPTSDPDDQTITGTIVAVDDGDAETPTVIVIDNPDGSEGAAAVTPETEVTGDLVPGQEVEVVLGDDGFSADEIVVGPPSDTPEPTVSPTSIATPAPPAEYKLIGKIREVSSLGVILDDVYLTIDSGSPNTEPLTVGEEIQFTVTVDESGRWVIVGVDQ